MRNASSPSRTRAIIATSSPTWPNSVSVGVRTRSKNTVPARYGAATLAAVCSRSAATTSASFAGCFGANRIARRNTDQRVKACSVSPVSWSAGREASSGTGGAPSRTARTNAAAAGIRPLVKRANSHAAPSTRAYSAPLDT